MATPDEDLNRLQRSGVDLADLAIHGDAGDRQGEFRVCGEVNAPRLCFTFILKMHISWRKALFCRETLSTLERYRSAD